MKIRISCTDEYEAKKLASLIFIKDSQETFITEIINIFDNEIVVALKDKSAHSVILKDTSHVEIFADFIQSIIDKEHKIVSTTTYKHEVEIVKG